MEASIIVTYRCQGKCQMCHTWKYPTRPEEEFKPSLLEKLPKLSFCNITGGEPFLRKDIEEIVHIATGKASRVVISTNGYLTEKIIDLASKNKQIGIRISIEGLPGINDELRGLKDGFDHGLRTLLELQRMGLKDIGFGITVSDRNAKDLLALFHLANGMKVEFATAVIHNSYYFHKDDNTIHDKKEIVESFRILIRELLKSGRMKNWYRAYFNYGLVNYVYGKPRLLPCRAGTDIFFVDPSGQVLPCNGMDKTLWFRSLGNLHEKSFADIWNSQEATRAREAVQHCSKNCWMVGTAGPAMKREIWKPTLWILKNKMTGLQIP